MKNGGNYNVKSISLDKLEVAASCQGLLCQAIGKEYVELNIGNDKVINIWACEKCAKQLR